MDSAELWNRWLFESLKREDSTFGESQTKQKLLNFAKLRRLVNYGLKRGSEAKTFTHLVRDSGSLCFACEILRFGILDSGFCGIVESKKFLLLFACKK